MSEVLTPTNKNIEIPNSNIVEIEVPKKTEATKKIPKSTKPSKEIPSVVNQENCIMLNGKQIEIKPTKLKYFRNRMASIYTILRLVPLTEFLAYEKGTFDEERNSDQMLLDFLVAVFDNEELVTENYNDMTSEDIEQILKIFGRINHIDEKEEASRKNREAQAKH